MSTPVNYESYDDGDPKDPVTLARVLLTNRIMEQLIEELGERLFSIRKIAISTQKETAKSDPNYGVYEAMLRILNEKIETNLWNLGDDPDE